MPIPYDQNKMPRAKELRKSMTPQEKKLWYQFLSRYPVRFQRQKTIGGFIADFFCAMVLLVIEVDGKQHASEQGLAYDLDRTNILKKNHLEVLRFSNCEIDNDFGSVCHQIAAKVASRINEMNDCFASPHPPQWGR